MSATLEQCTTSDTAAQELWRIAETGDVEELARVFLSGVHINVRNKHGMTALMRAACYGHAPMVGALLERGADPNLARNDKFTALALAAFFGHTETVKLLVEHGARTELITRCGASAQTWAIRRTFVEAAHCLESHTPAPAPAPVVAPAPAAAVAPAPVIKTLKDPPEIWDLVHEVPRGFNARSAFVSRLTSVRTSFALGIAAVVVLSTVAVVGVWVLRGSQARSLHVEAPAKQSVVATEVGAPVNVETSETPVGPSTPVVNEFSHHSESRSGNGKGSRRATPQSRSRATSEEETLQSAQSREVPPPPIVATPKVEPPRSSNKSNSTLSPQLIAPAKSATPKGKVIQWP